jgi:hypothetical protein
LWNNFFILYFVLYMIKINLWINKY